MQDDQTPDEITEPGAEPDAGAERVTAPADGPQAPRSKAPGDDEPARPRESTSEESADPTRRVTRRTVRRRVVEEGVEEEIVETLPASTWRAPRPPHPAPVG